MVDGQAGGTGWYRDPSGVHQFRYFDAIWTDQVSDAGVVRTSPLPVPAELSAVGQPAPSVAASGYPAAQFLPQAPLAPYANPGAPKSHRKLLWIGGAVTSVVVVAIIAIAVTSGSSSTGGGGGAVSTSQFCTDLGSRYDGGSTGAGSVPGALFHPQDRAQIQAAIVNATDLAAEAPTASLKADLTTIATDLKTSLSSHPSDTTAPGSDEDQRIAAWHQTHCH